MWLEELVNYVRAQNVAGVGQNVYAFTLKENDVGALLTSHTSGVMSSPELPDYYKGALQVIVRSNSTKSALDQSQAVSDLLSSNAKRKLGLDMRLILPNTYINYIYPRHLPVVFSRSDGDFYEASVNFDICFVAIS